MNSSLASEGQSEVGLVDRMLAASRLDADLYREVSLNRATRWQALAVVLLVGLANGLGLIQRFGVASILVGLIQGCISWILWSAVVVVVAFVVGGRRRAGSVMRATAFANSPGMLLVFGAVPLIGPFVRNLIAVWMVAATVPGVRALYGLQRWRAVVVAVGSFLAYWGLGLASDYFVG
ncbi:MAG: YIP1 family protein [Deltaproteobacteria bacterium]|nr:YIP1 family protein [Deltaproteobacteria bacterium]